MKNVKVYFIRFLTFIGGITKLQSSILVGGFIFAVFIVIMLGMFCVIDRGLANLLILALTLMGIMIYAAYTNELATVDSKRLEITLTPIITTELGEARYSEANNLIEFDTSFCIRNHSVIHAVGKVNLNSKLDEKPLQVSDDYSGKLWWYFPAQKKVTGHFKMSDLLKSVNLNCNAFLSQKCILTLEIKVYYKRWSQKEDKPLYENPVEKWHFDTERRKWIHEPTTSVIQFPTLYSIGE